MSGMMDPKCLTDPKSIDITKMTEDEIQKSSMILKDLPECPECKKSTIRQLILDDPKDVVCEIGDNDIIWDIKLTIRDLYWRCRDCGAIWVCEQEWVDANLWVEKLLIGEGKRGD